MVRYFGPEQPTRLVLERRPEVVTVFGRVDAYLIGSGVDPAELALDGSRNEAIMDALVSGLPVVLDAGALEFVTRTTGPTVITPHQRELARLLREHSDTVSAEDVVAEPGYWAEHAAEKFGVTVILKGAHTHICRAASGAHEAFHARIESPTTWMATAGTGDVLAGITAAIVATHAQALEENPRVLAHLAATAAFIHAEAGYAASHGGPLVALDVAESVPGVIADLIAGRA
jgi:NAD(P)H-hydrate repair Nnr-like enzyme with NAD(P)H-hydrate dehydratase domain